MTLIQNLERLNYISPIGVYLESFAAAVELMTWAHDNPDYACSINDRMDGSFEVQLDGFTMPTVKATLGQWIVLDGGQFAVMSQDEWASVYKVQGT